MFVNTLHLLLIPLYLYITTSIWYAPQCKSTFNPVVSFLDSKLLFNRHFSPPWLDTSAFWGGLTLSVYTYEGEEGERDDRAPNQDIRKNILAEEGNSVNSG